MKTNISENVKFLRTSDGLSQIDFANKFDVSRDNIASYERGTKPKLEFLTKLVNYFHISIEDLLNSDIEKLRLKIAPNSAGKIAPNSKNTTVQSDQINNSSIEEPEGSYDLFPMDCKNCQKLENDIFVLRDLLKSRDITIVRKDDKIEALNRQIGRLEGENDRLNEKLKFYNKSDSKPN